MYHSAFFALLAHCAEHPKVTRFTNANQCACVDELNCLCEGAARVE
jgi:hypothetical protein